MNYLHTKCVSKQRFVVADPIPRIVDFEDSPAERISEVFGLAGSIHKLASPDDAVVLAAARSIVSQLSRAGLTMCDLSAKVCAEGVTGWFPVARLPTKNSARKRRV